MKHLAVFAVFVLSLSLLPMARAQQGPDEQYLVIYGVMKQGDTFDNAGEPQRALEDYNEAQKRLQKFQKVFPDWYPKIVSFRLNYLADKIAEINTRMPATNAAPAAVSAAATPAEAAAAKAKLESQLKTLRDQLKQLQSDNTTLQAKLKEALSVQPATVSTTQFDQVQAQVRSLTKENDLLKVSLAQKQSGAGGIVNTQAVAQLNLVLAETKQKLAAQTTRADKLAVENQSLQSRLKTLMASAGAAEALRQENELLKRQMAGLKSAPAAAPTGSASAELTEARAQIAALRSAAKISSLEKTALENRVKRLKMVAVNPSAAEVGLARGKARIRELEKERDALQAKLGEANHQLQARTNQVSAAQLDALAQQVDTLRARIAVDEAKPIPYTPEELALFKQPTAPLTANNPHGEEKSIKELPGGTASLAAEAQHYYTDRQYDKAEANYQKILQQDKNNGIALANLAAIELEENKLDDADKHIQAALVQSPNDAYNLTVLGRVRFAEAKYDEALDALSRAAKLDPKNPDIENYLGVTLAQKGLRAQAETALRRAVELNPNYASAHNNLAVIYLTQKPPMAELARWHYEKALANGQPHNAALEKLLAKDGAPISP